ncbi:hypothetical protein DPEC_G00288240 [Dallia pectoralis]|uniref:Uncharacterized protein n=1 Tax=Dallia pectoralis TaxID=75939 RepID=A0ACC2FKR7_DALPE|nr:hypothetical protein DPEC_G00288240 [Dallia pectoralis]
MGGHLVIINSREEQFVLFTCTPVLELFITTPAPDHLVKWRTFKGYQPPPHLLQGYQPSLLILGFSLVCSLSALAAVSFLYVSRGNQSEFLPEETKSHLVSTPSANLRGCELCAKDWVFHGGKCYFFSTDSLNWTQSRDHCVSMGGHLVIINSRKEQSFLMSWSEDLWIGLNDLKTEGQWFWVDNEPLGQNGMNFWIKWGKTSKEPDNSKAKDSSGENCAAQHYYEQFSGWVDVSCGELHAFVCEVS